MGISTLITFIGLLIAATSLLKVHQRLFIKLRLSLLDKIVAPIIFILCFLIPEYFADSKQEIKVFRLNLKLSYVISVSACLLLLAVALYIFLKVKNNRLKRRKINVYSRLVNELINKREYPGLLRILNDDYSRLIKYSSESAWHHRVKKRILTFFSLKPKPIDLSVFKELPAEIIEILENERRDVPAKDDKRSKIKNKINSLLSSLNMNIRHYIGITIRSFIRDTRDKTKDKAFNVLHSLLSNNAFVSEMIILRPELGLKIFSKEFREYHEYVDLFFYEMIKNNSSRLYYEIKNNENISDYYRYALKDENIVLSYLFKDCNVARKLEVYRGVGNYLIDYLREINKQSVDSYIYKYENFDIEKWKSPLFVGIFFFDIMVSEAIYQGINSHMWLFYYRYFVENILKNCDYRHIQPELVTSREDAPKYSYLVDEIISNLCSWIETIIHGKVVNPEIDNTAYQELGGGNIIMKSSIQCLMQILKMIARDEKTPANLKAHYADGVIRTLFELKTADSETANRYGDVLFNGFKFYLRWPFKEINRSFYEMYKDSYSKFDTIPYIMGVKTDKGRELDTQIKKCLEELSDQ